MKKIIHIFSIFALFASSAIYTSCKKDEPFVKPKLSFSSDAETVKESDGTIKIEVTLDKPTIEDFTVQYTLSGTALDKASVGTSDPFDYEVLSGDGQLDIKKGDQSGFIEIKLYSDRDFEDEETIEIEIDKVTSKNIELTSSVNTTITVQQEDGLIVALEWGVGTGENYTDVDMDLFLWTQNGNALAPTNFTGLSGKYSTSLIASVASPEFFYLPTAAFNDGNYGITCNYYEGTKDPMNFQVSFIKIVNQNEVSTTVKKGTYHLANINKWDDNTIGTKLLLALTFNKVGADFNNFSEITVASSGSRATTSSELLSVVRNQSQLPYTERLLSILRRVKR